MRKQTFEAERKASLKERFQMGFAKFKMGFAKFKAMNFKDLMVTILLIAPYAILFIIFIAIPVAMAVYLSLTNFNVIEKPVWSGLTNYITLITQDEIFLKYVLPNTLKYALIVGPIGYMLSFIVAWMLAQIQKIPRTILATILYLPSMLGGVFISIIWKTFFSGDENGYLNAILLQLDIIDTPIQFLQSPAYLLNIVILVSLWSSMGVGFLALLAGVLNVPSDQYEAGAIDGINNRFQEMIYITIPNMRPQMLFGAVMAIVSAFNNGGIGVTLSGVNPTPEYSAQLIINHIEDYGYARYEMGYAAALAVVLLLLVWLMSKIAYALFADKD